MRSRLVGFHHEAVDGEAPELEAGVVRGRLAEAGEASAEDLTIARLHRQGYRMVSFEEAGRPSFSRSHLALGFVVAAKSVARFRELESQRFADYYLIGTLGSILVAIATGILVRALVFA